MTQARPAALTAALAVTVGPEALAAERWERRAGVAPGDARRRGGRERPPAPRRRARKSKPLNRGCRAAVAAAARRPSSLVRNHTKCQTLRAQYTLDRPTTLAAASGAPATRLAHARADSVRRATSSRPAGGPACVTSAIASWARSAGS